MSAIFEPVTDLDHAIKAYYAKPGNGCGGSLHIVLDDSNLHDHSVRFCIEYAQDAGDADGVSLGERLLAVPYRERCEMAFVCPCCREELRTEACDDEACGCHF